MWYWFRETKTTWENGENWTGNSWELDTSCACSNAEKFKLKFPPKREQHEPQHGQKDFFVTGSSQKGKVNSTLKDPSFVNIYRCSFFGSFRREGVQNCRRDFHNRQTCATLTLRLSYNCDLSSYVTMLGDTVGTTRTNREVSSSFLATHVC